MRKGFLFRLHLGIYIILLIFLAFIMGYFGFVSIEFYIALSATIMFNGLFYPIIGVYKEYKHMDYKMNNTRLEIFSSFALFVTIILYVFFKVKDNGFSEYWYLYYLAIFLSFDLSVVIALIINYFKKKKDNNKPMFIRNK